MHKYSGDWWIKSRDIAWIHPWNGGSVSKRTGSVTIEGVTVSFVRTLARRDQYGRTFWDTIATVDGERVGELKGAPWDRTFSVTLPADRRFLAAVRTLAEVLATSRARADQLIKQHRAACLADPALACSLFGAELWRRRGMFAAAGIDPSSEGARCLWALSAGESWRGVSL